MVCSPRLESWPTRPSTISLQRRCASWSHLTCQGLPEERGAAGLAAFCDGPATWGRGGAQVRAPSKLGTARGAELGSGHELRGGRASTAWGLPGAGAARAPGDPLRRRYSLVARHDEQRGTIELVNRPQPLGVVILRDVHDLLLRCHARDRHAVVEPAVDADQATVLLPRNQIEGEVTERHRDDGVECVGIAGAHEIAEPLVDDVDAATLVVLR